MAWLAPPDEIRVSHKTLPQICRQQLLLPRIRYRQILKLQGTHREKKIRAIEKPASTSPTTPVTITSPNSVPATIEKRSWFKRAVSPGMGENGPIQRFVDRKSCAGA
jgi:hypothetical protein